METDEINSWKTPTFRQSIIAKINKAILTEWRYGTSIHTAITGKQMREFENNYFLISKTKKEYLNLVAKLIDYIKDEGKRLLTRTITQQTMITDEENLLNVFGTSLIEPSKTGLSYTEQEKHIQNVEKQCKRKDKFNLSRAQKQRFELPSCSRPPPREVGYLDPSNSKKRKQEKSTPELSLKLIQEKQRPEKTKIQHSKLTKPKYESVMNKVLNFDSLISNKSYVVHLCLREVLEEQVKEEELNAFKIALEDAILKIPDGQIVPRFLNTIASQGMITVICENEGSEKWLRESATKWKAGELQVRLVSLEELTKRVKMTVLLPRSINDTEKAFKLLFKQNKGLETHHWLIHEKIQQDLSTLLVLGVDERSAGHIKDWGYKAFLGSGHVIFHPVEQTASTSRI